MLHKIKEHAVEFVVVTILFGGLLYAVTTSFRNSIRLDQLESSWSEKEKSFEQRFSALASRADSDSKLFKRSLLSLMIKSGTPVNELEQLFGSAKDLQDVIDSFEGRPPRAFGSDLRLKTSIRPIEDALKKTMKLTGVSFEWLDTHQLQESPFSQNIHYGVVAQDVEKVFPALVTRNERGHRSVDYAGLVAVLIEAIKEQQEELEALRLHEALSARSR